jgi:hypothetical protein
MDLETTKPSEGWTTQDAVARFLEVSERTVEGWRFRNSGPPYAKCVFR